MNKNWTDFMSKLSGFKGITSIGVSQILGGGISAIFWFYIASIMEPEEYGEISYFIGIAGLVSYFVMFGTEKTITVYTAKNVRLQSTFSFISLIIGIIGSLVLIIIFYRIDVVFILFGFIINTLAIGDLLGRKLYLKYSKYFLTQKILTLVLGVGFYYLFGVNGVLIALGFSYIAYGFRVYIVFRSTKIDFSLLKSRVGFIGNNYIMDLISGVYGQIDKIIIVPILGFVVLGNYALALQVVTVLMILPNVVFKYILPEDASGNPNKKIKKLAVISAIGLSIFGITVLPLVIPFAFPKYLEVISAIQVVSLFVIPATIINLYTSKFLAKEKSKFVLINNIIAVFILVIGMIVLGSSYGIIGVSTALVLSACFSAVFLFIIDRTKFNVQNNP